MDESLSSLQLLHEHRLVIPLPFMLSMAELLTYRRDVPRTERLLNLATSNGSLLPLDRSKDLGTKSKPLHLPVNKIISYAISGLLKYGVYASAFQLWLRMTSDGYLLSRGSIETLMQRAAASSCAPPEEFIARIHAMMRDNLWHTSPRYYSLLLCNVRQALTWTKRDLAAFSRCYLRLQELVKESEEELGQAFHSSTELSIVILQCYSAAAITARSYGEEGKHIQAESLDAASALLTDIIRKKPISLEEAHDSVQAVSTLTSLMKELSNTNTTSTATTSYSLFGDRKQLRDGERNRVKHNDLTRNQTRLDHVSVQLLIELAKDGNQAQLASLLRLYALEGDGAKHRGAWLTRCLPIIMENLVLSSGDKKDDELREMAHLLVDIATQWHQSFQQLLEGEQANRPRFDTAALEQNICLSALTLAPLQTSWRDAASALKTLATDLSPALLRHYRYPDILSQNLCRYKEEGAIAFAVDMVAAHNKAEPATLMALLIAARDCCAPSTVRHFLSTLERLLRAPALQRDLDVQLQLLYTYASLNDGYQALLELRAIQRLQSSRRVPLKAYGEVLNALYFYEPQDDAGHQLVRDPKTSCSYILELMSREGQLPLTAVNAVQMLKLHSKAISLTLADNLSQKTRESAVNELLEDARKLYESSSLSPMSQEDRELLRAAFLRTLCVAECTDQAMDLLQTSQSREDDLVTALSFEPIVYRLSAIDVDLMRAEDLLTLMMNASVDLSPSIVDAFVLGHMHKQDLKGALDRALDMYNQHGVAPSIPCVVRLLRANLEGGDVYEGRRVVGVLEVMKLVTVSDDAVETKSNIRKTISKNTELQSIFEKYGMSIA